MRRFLSLSFSLLLVVTVGFVAAPSLFSIVDGQEDDFDADLNGWKVGNAQAGSPNWEADGGRLGAGDGFMRVTSKGGGGAGSKLAVYNEDQWVGDYAAAGVDSITMDLKNLGATALKIRLVVESLGPRYISTEPMPLAVGRDWVTATFSLAEADLTNIPNSVDYASVISNVTTLRLVHSELADFPPESIVAEIGVDNILAGTRPTVGTEREAPVDLFTIEPVYPNPSSMGASVDVITPIARIIRVSVVDLLGREVQVAYDRSTSGSRTTVNLKTGSLASGLYLLRVQSGGRVKTQAFSVVR